MTKTGTQNRPYDETRALWVRVIFSTASSDHSEVFDWNKRESVQRFARLADEHIRSGGTVTTQRMHIPEATPARGAIR